MAFGDRYDQLVAHLADHVVEELAIELDPDEAVWPDSEALEPLKHDLKEVIDGAIADWECERREQPLGIPDGEEG